MGGPPAPSADNPGVTVAAVVVVLFLILVIVVLSILVMYLMLKIRTNKSHADVSQGINPLSSAVALTDQQLEIDKSQNVTYEVIPGRENQEVLLTTNEAYITTRMDQNQDQQLEIENATYEVVPERKDQEVVLTRNEVYVTTKTL